MVLFSPFHIHSIKLDHKSFQLKQRIKGVTCNLNLHAFNCLLLATTILLTFVCHCNAADLGLSALLILHSDTTHLGWPGGISLGLGSMLLLKVSGLILSSAN